MAAEAGSPDADRWRHHLETALARPGEKIILASLSDGHSMVMQVGTTRPIDLVHAARSLLEQALDAIDDVARVRSRRWRAGCAWRWPNCPTRSTRRNRERRQ